MTSTLRPLTTLLLTIGLTAWGRPTAAQPSAQPDDRPKTTAADGTTPAASTSPSTPPRTAPAARPPAAVKPPTPPPQPRAPVPTSAKGEEARKETGFGFGSYGRIGVAGDLKGGPGRQANITSHGPRLGEGPYLELDLYYKMRPYKDVRLKTVVTLAFMEELFHFSGKWDSALALRNFYLEASDLFVKGLSFWVGSRMYRGDDIYLFDFWPLDNLNTLGGGVAMAFGRHGQTRIAWHIGVNRLADQYQYQEVPVPGLNNTSEMVVLLNRQRMITSLKAEQLLGGRDGKIGAKIKLYGEYHYLPSGVLDAHLAADQQETLEQDSGFLLGLQLGIWNFGPRSHANLFLRYAQGLAAYGEFAIPFGLAQDKRAASARELTLALSANYELKRWFGVQLGGYVRYFKDADANKYDWDDGWEYVFSVRPHVFLHKLFAVAMELSYQAKSPAGLNPWTHEAGTPGVLKFSIMPLLTFGKGTYARPQFRLIYTVYHQNTDARMTFNPMDPRRDISVGHYLGIQAEWWFNSTYR